MSGGISPQGGIKVVHIDSRFQNSIVVVDADANTHDWDGSQEVPLAYQNAIDEFAEYLVSKGILPARPTVVMMTKHQAMEELTPEGPGARTVAPPLAVIIHDLREDAINFGYAQVKRSLTECYNNQSRAHPTIPPMIQAFTVGGLGIFGDAEDKRVFQEKLLGALVYGAAKRTPQNVKPSTVALHLV